VVQLAQREKQKYSLTPDMRLNIRLNAITWPNIYDELLSLRKLCDPIEPAPKPQTKGAPIRSLKR